MKKFAYCELTLAEIFSRIDKSKPLAFDIETIGLYGEIATAQFYQSNWDAAVLVTRPDIFELTANLKSCHIVCHNTSYEVSTIQTQLGKVLGKPTHKWIPTNWDDTLLLAKLEYWKQEKFALDDCYQYLFGHDVYASYGLDKDEMHKANWSGPLTENQKIYACLDVFYLLDLYDACADHLDAQYYQLDKSATTNAFNFQTNGFPISFDRIDSMIAEAQAKIDELACPINVNSFQQVRKYIGESTSDALALTEFALLGNDRARQVLTVRKLIKKISFLNKYKDQSHDERIYGKFLFTTKSGRGQCKDQNLQQLPRSTKQVFEAPKGNVIVMSDYAQLELRYICAITGDNNMGDMFKQDLDMHTYAADLMNAPRQQAKTCNFNLSYGGSAKMLKTIFIKDAELMLDLGEVQTLKNKWHNLWPTLTAWQEQATKDWRAGKPFKTLLGRTMYAKFYTDAMNLPIQGGSADISKLAMHKMFNRVAEHPKLKDAKFINFIHDNFMWECPDDPTIYKPLAQITAESMLEAWNELVQFTKIPDLPMPVEVDVGYNWGDMEYEIEKPKYQVHI